MRGFIRGAARKLRSRTQKQRDFPGRGRGVIGRIKTVAAKRQDVKRETVKLNRAKFLSWVKTKYPKVYRMALLKAGNRNQALSGLGQETDSWWDKIVTGIQEVIPAALQYRQQKDIMKMQLQRAQAGLPPANVADYTPVLKIQTEIAPETRAAFIDQLGKPIIFGGLALAAFMMFSGKKRRR